jgi:biopolymer transport protein ExbB
MVNSTGRAQVGWRGLAFFCVIAALVCAVLVVDATPVFAQETAEQADADKPSDSLFSHFVRSLGWFFTFLFLGISIGLVALIVLLVMDLRMQTCIPPAFVQDFTDMVNKKRFKEAFDLARTDSSFLARVMTISMARLQYGLEDAREVAVNTVESIRASKEQLISYLATIGTLGPLLGLVGTVFGMILSFMELGKPGMTPKPAKLAEGISHALVVTLVGIGLAVPAIFAHTFFRNRLIRISMDTSNMADDLLTQMYHSSRRPGTPAPTETRAPAAPVTVKPA